MPLNVPSTTPVPDEIFDIWAPQLREGELRALLYIARRTLGFNKRADAISLNQFLRGITTRDGRVLDGGCGIKCRRNLLQALRSLEMKGLVHATRAVSAAGDADVTVYALWWAGDSGADEEVQGGVETTRPVVAEHNDGGSGGSMEVGAERHHGSGAEPPTRNSFTRNSPRGSATRGGSVHVGQGDEEAAIQRASDCHGIWSAVCDDLRQTMTKPNFERWIASTVATGLVGGDLWVRVNDDFARRVLDGRLRHCVDAALARLGYTYVQVTFTVSA